MQLRQAKLWSLHFSSPIADLEKIVGRDLTNTPG